MWTGFRCHFFVMVAVAVANWRGNVAASLKLCESFVTVCARVFSLLRAYGFKIWNKSRSSTKNSEIKILHAFHDKMNRTATALASEGRTETRWPSTRQLCVEQRISCIGQRAGSVQSLYKIANAPTKRPNKTRVHTSTRTLISMLIVDFYNYLHSKDVNMHENKNLVNIWTIQVVWIHSNGFFLLLLKWTDDIPTVCGWQRASDKKISIEKILKKLRLDCVMCVTSLFFRVCVLAP